VKCVNSKSPMYVLERDEETHPIPIPDNTSEVLNRSVSLQHGCCRVQLTENASKEVSTTLFILDKFMLR